MLLAEPLSVTIMRHQSCYLAAGQPPVVPTGPLPFSWLSLTDPRDVARVESKTFIVTPNKRETTPTPAEGVQGALANWMSPSQYEREANDRFPGCMKGSWVLQLSTSPTHSLIHPASDPMTSDLVNSPDGGTPGAPCHRVFFMLSLHTRLRRVLLSLFHLSIHSQLKFGQCD